MTPLTKSSKKSKRIPTNYYDIITRASTKRLLRKSGAYYHNAKSLTPSINAAVLAITYAILFPAASIPAANRRLRINTADLNNALTILHFPIVL